MADEVKMTPEQQIMESLKDVSTDTLYSWASRLEAHADVPGPMLDDPAWCRNYAQKLRVIAHKKAQEKAS